jgi:hypothetical protein
MIKGRLHDSDLAAREALKVSVDQRVPVKDLAAAH